MPPIENGVGLQQREVTTRITVDGDGWCWIGTRLVSRVLRKEGLRRRGWLITSFRCEMGEAGTLKTGSRYAVCATDGKRPGKPQRGGAQCDQSRWVPSEWAADSRSIR